MLGRGEPDEGHRARRAGKSASVTELGGDGERRQIVDAADAAQPLDAWPERLEVEQGAEIVFDGGVITGVSMRRVESAR